MAHNATRLARPLNPTERPTPTVRPQQRQAPDQVTPPTVTWLNAHPGKVGRQFHEQAANRDETGRRIRLFGLTIFDTTVASASRWIVDSARRGVATHVSFVNAHCINVMYRQDAYRAALESSDRIFADGSGLAIAAKAAGMKLQDNVNGTDLFPVLCRDAAEAGVSLFLFGGQADVADRAAIRMSRDNPDLAIAGTHHGYISGKEQEDQVIARINASGASILLVGMGVPSQELWIARNRHRLAPAVIIGVGGLFDYYSDRIPRAPLLVRTFGCEWMWRLAMEPRRLARRYLLGNIEFLARLARLQLTGSDAFDQQLQS